MTHSTEYQEGGSVSALLSETKTISKPYSFRLGTKAG